MFFISPQKLSLFSEYLSFCLDFIAMYQNVLIKLLSWLFVHVSKRLDQNSKVNFKFYDVTVWLTNNSNTHIAQYLEKQRQSDNEIWSVNRILIECNIGNNFLEKPCTKCGGESRPRPFSEKSKLSVSLDQ